MRPFHTSMLTGRQPLHVSGDNGVWYILYCGLLTGEGIQANLSINGFTVVFVKPCYDLARAKIRKLSAQIVKQCSSTRISGENNSKYCSETLKNVSTPQNSFSHSVIKGQLKSINVEDLSPHGKLHRCKFMTMVDSPRQGGHAGLENEEPLALTFNFKKYVISRNGLQLIPDGSR